MMTVFVDFCHYVRYFKKLNLISFSYLARPSNWPSMSKINFLTVAAVSLTFSGKFTLNFVYKIFVAYCLFA